MGLFSNFKTSYVTVYRESKKEAIRSGTFQNILCYGLPCGIFFHYLHARLFQNILCYGLPTIIFSIFGFASLFQNILCYGLPFALYHQMVGQNEFQNILCCGLPFLQYQSSHFDLDFKTSYVTVYQNKSIRSVLWKHISKHPMLRFTRAVIYARVSTDKFQNILCYGLLNPAFTRVCSHAFQNILCYGLPRCIQNKYGVGIVISKHPMLRFTPRFFGILLFIHSLSKHPMLRFTILTPRMPHLLRWRDESAIYISNLQSF